MSLSVDINKHLHWLSKWYLYDRLVSQLLPLLSNPALEEFNFALKKNTKFKRNSKDNFINQI